MAGSGKDNGKAGQGTGKCPICAKEEVEKFSPFCSKRCADVDLSRWLKGIYRIPAVEPPDEWDLDAGRGLRDDEDEQTSH